MDIYIGNVPTSVDSEELLKVFKRVLSPNNLRERMQNLVKRSHKFDHRYIKVIVESSETQTLRYAYAEITPDHIARRAIARLDDISCQGSNLYAREYVARSHINDRRTRLTRNLYAVNAYNRRFKERRQIPG